MAKAQRVLGIEIGYSLTQVVEMDYQSKHPQVYGVFSMKTPDGIFNDGLINPTEEYVNDLKANIVANGMNAKKVIFAVSSTKIANREAVIPFVKKKQIRELLMTTSQTISRLTLLNISSLTISWRQCRMMPVQNSIVSWLWLLPMIS